MQKRHQSVVRFFAELRCSSLWGKVEVWGRGGGGVTSCSSGLLWLLIYSVYNSKAEDKCPAECTCAKIFINLRPPNLRRRKTNKFTCERQSYYIYMNMQDHGWDVKINLACMCFLPCERKWKKCQTVLDISNSTGLEWKFKQFLIWRFWIFIVNIQ